MITTNDIKKGLKCEYQSKPYKIVDCNFTNPGKGSAFWKVRMKNLETGLVVERTFKSGVETGMKEADLDEKEMSYMYDDQEGFNFMDQTSYESIHLTTAAVGDAKGYLQEGIILDILFYNGNAIALELPNFVNLKVAETDPGLKGDTAAGGKKKAVMETGLQINVPLFIKQGECLKIDTRTGDFVERVKE
jgi:elongation factor P